MISFFDKSPIQPKYLYINTLTPPLHEQGTNQNGKKVDENRTNQGIGETPEGEQFQIGIYVKVNRKFSKRCPKKLFEIF